jgi:hypothetical protein
MSYTGADSVVLLNQALNADQLNIPNQNIPHLVAWNLNSNSLQYVNTLNGNIDAELFSYINSYRNYVVVDVNYGDNAIASTDPYNSAYAFVSIEDAIANTQDGDLIVVNPGQYNIKTGFTIDVNTGSRGFYFFPNTIVNDGIGIANVIFSIDTVTCNIYGYGNFILSTIGGAAFAYNNVSSSELNCNSVTCLAEVSIAINSTDSTISANINNIECSSNLAAIYLAQNSNLVINATTASYSAFGFLPQDNCNTTINIPTITCYDGVDLGLVFPYVSACVIIGNDTIATLNGNISNAGQTFDPTDLAGALMIIGNNSSLNMTGGTSFIRNLYSFVNYGTNSNLRINASLINTCANAQIGSVDLSSTTYLAGRFEADFGIVLENATAIATIIMEYGVLKTLVANACFDGTPNPANLNYAVYSGAAVSAPVNSTDILGVGVSNLIVNVGVV